MTTITTFYSDSNTKKATLFKTTDTDNMYGVTLYIEDGECSEHTVYFNNVDAALACAEDYVQE